MILWKLIVAAFTKGHIVYLKDSHGEIRVSIAYLNESFGSMSAFWNVEFKMDSCLLHDGGKVTGNPYAGVKEWRYYGKNPKIDYTKGWKTDGRAP